MMAKTALRRVTTLQVFQNFSTTSTQFNYPKEVISKIGQQPSSRSLHRQVFSGIQPTGNIHLGNYLGAVTSWVLMQDTEKYEKHRNYINFIIETYTYHVKAGELLGKDGDALHIHAKEGLLHVLKNLRNSTIDTPLHNSNLLFCVVDLHALTIPSNSQALYQNTEELITLLLASGLSPEKCSLYLQSHVPSHSQLSWLLTCISPISWLYRMTQFKDKAQKLVGTDNSEESDDLLRGINAGLLNYPILMAADILAFNATHIPVGNDQLQHLELTRDIAKTFNSLYGKKAVNSYSKPFQFHLPEAILNTEAAKVMSLRVPTAKMSKSDPSDYSRICMNDSDDNIRIKIRKATTDSEPTISYDTESRPGISNLINIIIAIQNLQKKRQHIQSTIESVVSHPLHRILQDSSSPLQGIIHFLESNNTMDSIVAYKSSLDRIFEPIREQAMPEDVVKTLGISAKSTDLKNMTADLLIEEIRPIREKFETISNDKLYLKKVTSEGALKANSLSQPNIERLYEAMGYVTQTNFPPFK